MRRYWRRITRSARGELFNPLLWPFLLSTLAYGVGFTFFAGTAVARGSSLYVAMSALHPIIPIVWGGLALITIIGGLTFLLFNIPPYGKASGILGFMLWFFALFCYLFDGNYLLIFALVLPNMWFWIWQYLSLGIFRSEDRIDADLLERSNYDNVKQESGGDTEDEEGNTVNHYQG